MHMKLTGVIYIILSFLINIPGVYGYESQFNDPEKDTVSIKKPLKSLFASQEILELFLYVDNMKELVNDLGDNPDWHKGTFSYINEEDSLVNFSVKIQPRGHFRKDPVNCKFPPLRVNFNKKEVAGTLLDGQDKLKLVTHCRNRPAEYEQYVLKEYLAYRIYNIMTERSFRVRLLNITYVDKSGKKNDMNHFGFFIEDTKDMSQRNGFTHIKVNNIPQEYTDLFYQDLVSVFQYMIGNTDWSIPARHNIKLLLEKPDHRPVPVPYDFDWTGLVNPIYAKPSEKLRINSVEQRLFRGFEKNLDYYTRIFELFIQRRDKIYALLDECPLDDKHRSMATRYIDDFYEIISDERKAYRAFVTEARKPNEDNWGK